jgi:hypothetical protein
MALTYIGKHTSTSDAASYNFGTVDIGTAASDRLVVVLPAARSSITDRNVSAVSIAGTNGTLHVAPGTFENPTAVSSRLVTTGTTGNITVTLNGAVVRCGIFVFTLTDYTSATPHDTDGSNVDSTNTDAEVSATLTIPPGGVAVAVVATTGGLDPYAWVGAESVDGADVEVSKLAAAMSTQAEANHVIQYTWASAGVRGISAASWATGAFKRRAMHHYRMMQDA